MTDKELEQVIRERYAEFHRKEEPDTVIRHFNDFGYFDAMKEAGELETIKIPGAFFATKNPEQIIRAILAEGGRLLEEEDQDGVHVITGLYPYDPTLPQEKRKLNPPAVFVCWASDSQVYFVASGKNPPANPNALQQATDLFLDAAEKFDREEAGELEEAAAGLIEEKSQDGLTGKQKKIMAIIAVVVLILLAVFLIFK